MQSVSSPALPPELLHPYPPPDLRSPITRNCAASPLASPARLKPRWLLRSCCEWQGISQGAASFSCLANTCPLINQIRWGDPTPTLIRVLLLRVWVANQGCSKSSSFPPRSFPLPREAGRKRVARKEPCYRVYEKGWEIIGSRQGRAARAAGLGVTWDCTRSSINKKQREQDRINCRAADGLKTGIRTSQKQLSPSIWKSEFWETSYTCCKWEGQNELTCQNL